jgi:tetratricopeptide repeat protein 30
VTTQTLAWTYTNSNTKILKLEAAIRFEMEDFTGAKHIIEQSSPTDPDSIANRACLLLKVDFQLIKEGNFEEALKLYTEAYKIVGFRPDLAYGSALAQYLLNDYVSSLKNISKIIERGIRDHPGLILLI